MKFDFFKPGKPELLNDSDKRALTSELTVILFNNALRSNLVVFAAAAIILFIFYDQIEPLFFLPWSGCIIITTIYRLTLLQGFQSRDPDFSTTAQYKKRYLAATFVIALCWMAVIARGLMLAEFEQRVFFSLLLVSLLGASVPALAASLTAIYSYILVPSAAAVPLLFWKGGTDAAIAIALMIYILMMLKSGQYVYESLVTSTTLRLNMQNINSHLEEKVAERTRELEAARDEAEKANSAKSIFLANISHEIRTPMNVIINLSQLALEEEMTEKAHEFMRNVHTSGNNLLGIINDILDFSKIESGSFRVEQIPFDIKMLLEEIQKESRVALKGKECQFTIAYENDLSGTYIGDPLRVRQILTNIINNAIKFTEKGEVRVTVRERVRQDGTISLDFSVKDTGIGISAEQQKYLFQPFKQADQSTTRKYGGSGLGLVISRQLAEMMGGTISVESTTDSGSTFFISLVLERAQTPLTNTKGADDAKREVHRKLARLQHARILIVDDIPANQLILASILTNIKIDSVLAANGEEALGKLEEHDVDLVFMDIQMPVMDGFEATNAIRRSPRFSKLPVIAMTANALPQDVQKCYDNGMDFCLVKPINIDKVYEILIKYLEAV